MAISNEEVETTQVVKVRRLRSEKPKKPKKEKLAASQMTFFEHLNELRSRLVWSAAAIVVCTTVSWFFHEDLIAAFRALAADPMNALRAKGIDAKFINTDVVAGFGVYFEVALYAGLLLASPMLVYHVLAFMAPALEPERRPGEAGYEEEVKVLKSIRRSLIFFIPLVAIFFLVGIAFAYYLVLPAAVKFLLNFGADQFVPQIEIKKYIGQMTRIMFWSGLVFELPIFLFLLAKIRIVTWKKLASWWKWALVFSLVAAAFITPSPDILGQAIISVPVFGLFWLGVLFARFA